jgi:hypothetical protein
MRRRPFLALSLALSLGLASPLAADSPPPPTPTPPTPPTPPTDSIDEVVNAIAPGILKRASVIITDASPASSTTPVSRTFHSSGSADAIDFWPASTIKLYTAIAAMEAAHARGFPLDALVLFEHRNKDGRWITDCSRTLREMSSEVFRRSSNEDYTLHLRITGIDALNEHFLTPARGFPHSALMRGYVTARPYVYLREEPQRITLFHGDKRLAWEHSWSGRSWSKERGATVIDAATGNCSTTAELVSCLHRLFFHNSLPPADRFRISDEMADFLLHGADGLSGLETTNKDSGPFAWEGGKSSFPNARWYHKCGLISNHALDVACADDRANSGRAVFLCAMVQSGKEDLIRQLCGNLLAWAKRQP